MSIKPIDLQTLFVKLDEVSKEQNLAKEQAALQQSQAARAQVTKEIQQDHSVNEVPEDRENEAVKDDDEEKQGNNSRRTHDRNREYEDAEDERVILSDPDIGQHVDLSG